MSSSFASTAFTRKNKSRAIAACALAAGSFFLLAVGFACFGGPVAHEPAASLVRPAHEPIDRAVWVCLSAIAFSFWGGIAYLRCLDPRTRRRIAAISVILALWLLVVVVKWKTADDELARYLWYCYYIPMAAVPPLCLSCALRSAGLGLGEKGKRHRAAIASVSALFIVLALTNDLHQLFFTFDSPNPGTVGKYFYGPAYWAFLVYTAVCFIGFFAVLWRSCTSVLRSLLVPSATVAVAGFLLSSAYIFRLEWARTLNFSLIYGILVIVALELCLDLGIIPSTRSFAKVFAKLPFDLKIVSRDGSLFRKTEASAALDPSVARALASRPLPDVFTLPAYPDDVFFAWPLSGGSALLTRDMRNMRSLGRQLMARRADLEQDRRTLEHDRDLAELLAGLEAESRLVGDVERALSDSMREVSDVLRGLPQEPAARLRELERARMIVAYCKRKGSLVLAEAVDPELDRDRIRLIANELASDLRAVGIDCAAIASLSRPLAAQQMSVLYDCIYDVAFTALECKGPVLMYHLGERNDGTVELRAHLESEDEEDLASLPRTEALRARLDACDVIYSLTGEEGRLLLVVRVRTGGGRR